MKRHQNDHLAHSGAVPLTFLAHQAPVLPLKLARPRWFDGTALCLGAAAPDLAYPLGAWISAESHTAIGVLAWAVPWTLVACVLMRRYVAPTAFAQLPDLGPLRLHSLRVLADRRPAILQTIVSALIGATSHVFIDGFTHRDRFGANWLGLNDELFTVLGRVFTAARVVQYVGHTFGSLVGLALLAHIGRRRKLEEWYGDAAVRAARSFALDGRARLAFWSIVLLGLPAAVLWARASGESVIFTAIDATLASLLVACMIGWSKPTAGGEATHGRPGRRAPDRVGVAGDERR